MIKTAGFIVVDPDGLAWGKGRSQRRAWESAHATIEALASLQGQFRSRIIEWPRPAGLACKPATRGVLADLEAARPHTMIVQHDGVAMTDREHITLLRKQEEARVANILADAKLPGGADGDETKADPSLPPLCVAVLPGTWRPVVIRKGARNGTWKWATGAARGEAFNQHHGITDAQVAAMVVGVTKGWDHPDAWPSRAAAETQEG